MRQIITAAQNNKVFSDWLQSVTVALVISLVLYLFIVTPNKVYSISMQPNFYEGDYIITDKVINWFNGTSIGHSLDYEYHRGDIVVINIPVQGSLIKRLIALGGDTIMVKEGSVYVNQIKLNESYLPFGTKTQGGTLLTEGKEVLVPVDSVVVMGDNRNVSLDSRFIQVGFIHKNNIQGRVNFRFLPLDKFGGVK